MANNRVFLICNVCQPVGKEWPSMMSEEFTNAFLHMGKWYPGGDGAYYNAPEKQWLEDFYLAHAHTELASEHYTAGAGQENPVRLEYESDGLPILPNQTP